MSTTLETVETAVKADAAVAKTWLQKHERIVLSIILSAAALFGTSKYLGVVEHHDDQQTTIAQQTLAVQKSKDDAAAAATAQDVKQYQVLVQNLSQQNAQLAAAATNRTVVLQQQQETDKTLPMPDLGDRWTQLAGLKQGDLTATTAGITVTPAGALDTVQELEQVPVLKANLADAQTQITNGQAELAKANTVVTDQAKQIDGLNTELVDQKSADDKTLAAEKASARKGKLRSFFYGVGVGAGVVLGEVIHHVL